MQKHIAKGIKISEITLNRNCLDFIYSNKPYLLKLQHTVSRKLPEGYTKETLREALSKMD